MVSTTKAISAITIVALVSAVVFASEQGGAQVSELEQAIVDLTNKERQQAGLEPLKINPQLMQAAREHSKTMADRKLLSHEIDGKGADDRVKALGYKYFTVGENIGWNEPDAESAVRGWMNSPGHRANILKKDFTEIGVGMAKDDKDQPYYTQVFARPQSAGPTVQATFTITNEADRAVMVQLPGNSPASMLQHGEKAMYSMSGGGDSLPEITIRLDDYEKKVKVEDGATITVEPGEGIIEVRSETQPR